MGFFGNMAGKVKEKAKESVNAEGVKKNWDWITDGAKKFKPVSPDQLFKEKERESFSGAMKKYGVSENDLKTLYQNWLLRFWIMTILLIAGVAIGLIKAYHGSFGAILATGGFAMIALSQMTISSLWLRRLSDRKFYSFMEWKDEPGKWIPKNITLPDRPKRKKRPTMKTDSSVAENPED